jgi:multiple sugar transport system ATP-binding protein
VRLREALGSEVIVHARLAAQAAHTDAVQELAEDVGVHALDGGESETTVVGRFAPRSDAQEDAPVEAVVDTRAMHFFDPATGLGIYDAPTEGADS